jgi:trimeric autotransporter adhesin
MKHMDMAMRKPHIKALVAAAVLFVAVYPRLTAQSRTYSIITTVAGAAPSRLSQDGLPATQATLNEPLGVAADGAGNLYVAESLYHRVRKIDPNGVISTIVGNGDPGLSGDGGPAVFAESAFPQGILLDNAGNIYISGSVIRKISPTGIITTVAGNQSATMLGDDGPATAAQLSVPYGMAMDAAGNIYVADQFNNRIRRIGTDGIITTVAGNGQTGPGGDRGPATSAQLDQPSSVAVDSAGDLYIADTNNSLVRKVSGGIITTVAGNLSASAPGDGGPAIAAGLSSPTDVKVDAAGNLYIADGTAIRKVTTDGIIHTVAGGVYGTRYGFGGDDGPATAATLGALAGLALDGVGNLFLVDVDNNLVRKIGPDGIIVTIAGSNLAVGDGGPATSALLKEPVGIALDSAGNLFILDQRDRRLRKVGSDGRISTVAGNGLASLNVIGGPAVSAQFYFPRDLTIDGTGALYIAEGSWVERITPDGLIQIIAGSVTGTGDPADGVPATSALLNNLQALAADAQGNLYIGEPDRIRKVNAAGIIQTIAGPGHAGILGDGGPAISAQLSVYGLAVDSKGAIYVADSENQRIRMIAPDGTIHTIAGTGNRGFAGDGGPAISAQLADPNGVAVDRKGNLYILQRNQIRQVTPDGIIHDYAGRGGQAGFAGDGLPAQLAEFHRALRVLVDPSGVVYVADAGNHRVRKIAPAAIAEP